MSRVRILIDEQCDIDKLSSVLYNAPKKIGFQVKPNNNTVIIMDEKTFQCEMVVAIVNKDIYKFEQIIEMLKLYVDGYFTGLSKGEEKMKNEFKRLFDIVTEQ